eukprot:10104460-Alexandrium_andersonii.AAC.1
MYAGATGPPARANLAPPHERQALAAHAEPCCPDDGRADHGNLGKFRPYYLCGLSGGATIQRADN